MRQAEKDALPNQVRRDHDERAARNKELSPPRGDAIGVTSDASADGTRTVIRHPGRNFLGRGGSLRDDRRLDVSRHRDPTHPRGGDSSLTPGKVLCRIKTADLGRGTDLDPRETAELSEFAPSAAPRLDVRA
jgi:hypothetical protein